MSDQRISIAALPFVETRRPLAAPAILKSALKSNGIESITYDLNVIVMAKIDTHPDRELFLDFFYEQKIHQEIVGDIARIIEYCTDLILDQKPHIVGLSLFCYTCQNFTAWLSASIKQRDPSCKIVIGGPGLQILSGAVDFNFPEKLRRLGLIDDYINGDGDRSFVEYVRGNLEYPGINSSNWEQSANLDDLPDPDYSDYDFFWYREPSIPIIDSRGCVQNCEFCDVIEFWKKYQYMTASRIFAQMMDQMSRYRINHFDFRSSISNGNLREFKKLLAMMAEYNEGKFRSEQISWEGSFIIRTIKQHDAQVWNNIKKSNGMLFMGVESVVEKVRRDLGKNFTNLDLDDHLDMAREFRVPVSLLVMTGYPTETLDDYEYVKQWFRDRQEYANNSVRNVQLSSTAILPGTRLNRAAGHYGIVDAASGNQWFSTKTNISKAQRMAYHNELVTIIKEECNFNVDG